MERTPDDSGVVRIETESHEEFESGRLNYLEHCPPECKESLYYRDTFTRIFVDVPKGDEEQLRLALMINPIVVAIQADQIEFQLYKGGIMDNFDCGTELDHSVLLVGFGTENGVNSRTPGVMKIGERMVQQIYYIKKYIVCTIG